MLARSSRPVAARLLSLALVTLVALALTGCNQLSAKRNLSRLENILSEIKVHQGQELRFRVQETLDLESSVQNIRDLVVREQYEQAAELAKQRMADAPGTLDAVIQDHAGFNRTRAEEDIRIAQDNDAQVLNQELWTEIMEHRERMNEGNAEQNWGRVIEHGQRVTDGVITLLQPLRNESNSLYETAITRMEEFDIYNASFHASDLVSESQTAVARVGELIGLRKYRQAISAAEEALTTISETIIESMASIAYIGITEIEGLTAEILEHGGEFRLGQRYRNFSEDWDSLLGFFFNGEYRQALAQIRVLTPIAQRLVVDSYQLEAEEFIGLREDEIAQLEDAEVRTYLPGSIDIAIELNTQADQTYDEGLATVAEIEGMDETAFNPDSQITRESVLLEEARPIFAEAVDLATDAGEEVDKIHRDFRELSETHLAEAQTELNEAVRLRDRLEQISDVRIEMAIEEIDRRFLENRETEVGSIEQDLESAQIRKAMGEFRLSEDPPRYNTAIELANQSRAEAVAVQDAIYTIATRYSLIELAWMIDHYEREGAGEYVTPELDRTRRLLEDTREILAEGNPREAISRAADTRAQLEIMIQSLRRVANEEIQELRRLQGETEQMLTQINAPERLELIAAQLAAAESHARNGDLKDAIETAQRGQRLANATTTEAAREWAQTEIEDARARIGHAEDAGASQYAAATLQDARDLLDSARRRFESEDFLSSQLAAAESGMRADEARLALISDAEEALVRARDYRAWDFSGQDLVEAQVAATRAIRYMDQGSFRESQRLAQASAHRAGELTDLAKEAIYRDRLANLRRSIEHAIETGSTYFQPEELESVLDDLAMIERDYNIANHDDFVRDFEALETRMALVIEATPAVLEATLDSYRDWVRRLRDEHGAELFAQDTLQEVAHDILAAEESFAGGHYRLAYRNVMEAGHTLQTIQLQADEFDYKNHVDEVLNQLAAARRDFSTFTSVSARMMTYLAIQPNGTGNSTAIAGLKSPTEFRREIERLQTLANQIVPPPTRGDQQGELLACLDNAERAARNFEYLLIADRMDEHTIRDTVDSAYLYLETSEEQSEQITQALIPGPLRGPVTMTVTGRDLLDRTEANEAEGLFRGDDPRLWY